jgi:cyclophilin family peptidyl-prolyl cis-trans isomerase
VVTNPSSLFICFDYNYRFGEGPHRVQVQLAFNPNGPDLQGTGDSFVIEMAPSDDMPHTVLWFLEQVDAGLYNGCSFQPAAAHVVMGGAAGNFLSEPDFHPRRRFLESEFPSVLFPEYSSNFPHVKYTLGLAGPSPGGPDFFVNAQDNSIDHTDPCFAKVIDGFETVDRMHQTPGGDEAASMIAIVAMRIIPRN